MKKLLPLFLALSLAVNAALIVTHIAADSLLSRTKPGASALKTNPTAADRDRANRAAAKLGPIPDNAELSSLQEKLAALNLPPEITREVMRAMLWKPLHDRQRAMLDAKNAGKPYWQQTGAPNKKDLTAAERAELRALSDQIETRATAIFGADALSTKAATRYAFLPSEKAAALQQLHRDYSDMHDGVADETSLFAVPSDYASRKLLREEQRRDLESILSPAELADYDLRYSSTASDLRKRFAALPDSTEAEYKAAYDIAQNLTGGKNDSASQTAAAAQLRELLGPERYAAFLRANDSDYTALQGAATRFDIAPATIDKVYGLRDQAVTLSQQIAADKNLSAKDKQLALKTLSTQLRNDVRTNLGPEVGNAYLAKNMNWLNNLADGSVLAATLTGKITAQPIGKDSKDTKNATATGAKSPKKTDKPAKDKKGK